MRGWESESRMFCPKHALVSTARHAATRAQRHPESTLTEQKLHKRCGGGGREGQREQQQRGMLLVQLQEPSLSVENLLSRQKFVASLPSLSPHPPLPLCLPSPSVLLAFYHPSTGSPLLSLSCPPFSSLSLSVCLLCLSLGSGGVLMCWLGQWSGVLAGRREEWRVPEGW